MMPTGVIPVVIIAVGFVVQLLVQRNVLTRYDYQRRRCGATFSPTVRAAMGVSALSATLLFIKAALDALSPGDQAVDTWSPAAIAVLLVVLIICLRVRLVRAERH